MLELVIKREGNCIILDPIMGSKMLGLRIKREENCVMVLANSCSEILHILRMVNASS